MSVVIQNMGYVNGKSDECLYAVRINREPDIAHCKHFRGDGLAVLLRKMADAIDKERGGK